MSCLQTMQKRVIALLPGCLLVALTASSIASAMDTTPSTTLLDEPVFSSADTYRQRAEEQAQQARIQAVLPQVLTYLRTAPGTKPAALSAMHEPSVGAAHALSLALDLDTELSPEQRAMLTQFGPWLTADGISENSQQLIRIIQDAAIHGLDPDAYGLALILGTVDALSHIDKSNTQASTSAQSSASSDSLRTNFSELLESAFTELATHLGQGIVDARATQNKLFRDAPTINPEALLSSVKYGKVNVREALNSVMPTQPEYLRLTQRMRDLLTERATGVERTRVNRNAQLLAPARYEDTIAIKQRLFETGDLPLDAKVTALFDSQLVRVLEQFQRQHGLAVTGKADAATRHVLNESIDDEITALALSLERWRWMPRDLGRKHVFVNVPDYRVVLRDGSDTLLSMVAVVGAKEHQTPSFSRDMSYMEFNPTWTVPASIANKELIPKERRKPGYLVSRQFDFLKREGNRLLTVEPDQITASDFEQDRFPYILRQRGGSINALGRMKFMMPNPYAIYLHDTQAKKHFTLNDRAFSHGCIRLSEPDRLAKLLMREDGYEESDISDALTRKDTHRIRLRSPIPTHLTYMTTWIDESGLLQQRADIYGQDAALTEALIASNTLLSSMTRPKRGVADRDLLASGDE